MAANGHSKRGASNAVRWLNCAGSVALIATLPKPPDTEYSLEGKSAHRVAELCLTENLNPEDFVSRIVEGVEVTPEMAESVNVYVTAIRDLWDREGVSMVVEQKVRLDAFDPDLWGTNDCSIITREPALHTWDYKHGAGVPVDVQDNPQLKYYALGALLAAGGGFEKVVLHVVQPRCTVLENPHQTYELTAIELMEFGFELAAGAAATREPDAPLRSGPWCKKSFCPAAGVCPRLYQDALEVASVEFDGVAAGEINPPNPVHLDSAEIGRRLAVADKLELWLKSIRSHAFAEAKAGRMPEGFKFVAKNGKRAWINPEKFIDAAAAAFGNVSRDELMTVKPISPSQLEKLVGKSAAKDFVKVHAETKRSGVSLVPLSNKKEAVLPEVLSEFEAIGDFPDDEE